MGERDPHDVVPDGQSWRPDVFDYVNARAFLNAYRERAAEQGKRLLFTFSNFASWAGLKSRSHMQGIFRGERPLSPKAARALGARLFNERAALNPAEKARRRAAMDYLVVLAQKTTLTGDAAKMNYRKLLAMRAAYRRDLLRPGDFDPAVYMFSWLAFALRQLAHLPDFEPTVDWVRDRLWATASDAQIREEILAAENRGDFDKDSPSLPITTGRDLTQSGYDDDFKLNVGMVHREALDVVKEAIERVPREQRQLEVKFVCLPSARFEEFRDRLSALMHEFDTVPDGDEVFQLHVSLVSLTHREDER